MNQHDIQRCITDYLEEEHWSDWSDFTDTQKERVSYDVMHQVETWQQKQEVITHWKIQQIAEQHIQEVLRFKRKLNKTKK